MKNLKTLSLFLALSLLFAACTQENLTQPSDKSYFETEGYMLTLDTLTTSSDSLYTQAGKKLGQTKAEAVVPLVFDTDGSLVTAEQLKEALEAGTAERFDVQFTDLKTFKKVMKTLVDKGSQKQARLDKIQEKYAHALATGKASNANLSTSSTEDELIYIYDAYEKDYMTDEEIQAMLASQPVVAKETVTDDLSTQDFAATGGVWMVDIAVSKATFNVTGNTGHAGIVTKLNCSGLRCSGNPNDPTTNTMEANPKSAKNTDELHAWPILKNLDPADNTNAIQMAYVPSLTDSQINSIKAFAVGQESGYYNALAPRWTSCDGRTGASCGWYCSLLVQKAYLRGANIELDPWGYVVWPSDLVSSAHTKVYINE